MSSLDSLEILEVTDPDQYIYAFGELGYNWTNCSIGMIVIRQLFEADKVDLNDGRNLTMHDFMSPGDHSVYALDSAVRTTWPRSYLPFTSLLLDTRVSLHTEDQCPRTLPPYTVTGFRGIVSLIGEQEVSLLSHEEEIPCPASEDRCRRLDIFNVEALRLTQMLRGISSDQPLVPFFEAAVHIKAGDVGLVRGEPNPVHFTTRLLTSADNPAAMFGRF